MESRDLYLWRLERRHGDLKISSPHSSLVRCATRGGMLTGIALSKKVASGNWDQNMKQAAHDFIKMPEKSRDGVRARNQSLALLLLQLERSRECTTQYKNYKTSTTESPSPLLEIIRNTNRNCHSFTATHITELNWEVNHCHRGKPFLIPPCYQWLKCVLSKELLENKMLNQFPQIAACLRHNKVMHCCAVCTVC